MENSVGLWWNAQRTKAGASGAEVIASEQRVAAGPMNLTSGNTHIADQTIEM